MEEVLATVIQLCVPTTSSLHVHTHTHTHTHTHIHTHTSHRKRLTASQCLAHPWVDSKTQRSSELLNIARLKSHVSSKKWQVSAMCLEEGGGNRGVSLHMAVPQ